MPLIAVRREPELDGLVDLGVGCMVRGDRIGRAIDERVEAGDGVGHRAERRIDTRQGVEGQRLDGPVPPRVGGFAGVARRASQLQRRAPATHSSVSAR